MQRREATPASVSLTWKWVCQPAGEGWVPLGLHCSKLSVKLPFPSLRLRQLVIMCPRLPSLRWRFKHHVGMLRGLCDVTVKHTLAPSKHQGRGVQFMLGPVMHGLG